MQKLRFSSEQLALLGGGNFRYSPRRAMRLFDSMHLAFALLSDPFFSDDH